MSLQPIHGLSTTASTIFAWTACGQLAKKATTDTTWYTVTCVRCLKKKVTQ